MLTAQYQYYEVQKQELLTFRGKNKGSLGEKEKGDAF